LPYRARGAWWLLTMSSSQRAIGSESSHCPNRVLDAEDVGGGPQPGPLAVTVGDRLVDHPVFGHGARVGRGIQAAPPQPGSYCLARSVLHQRSQDRISAARRDE